MSATTEADVSTECRYVGTREVARMYDVTKATVLNWIKEGKLPAKRTGGVWRILKEDADSFGERPRIRS